MRQLKRWYKIDWQPEGCAAETFIREASDVNAAKRAIAADLKALGHREVRLEDMALLTQSPWNIWWRER